MRQLSEESRAMQLMHGLGFESLAWSLRRLHCPVDAHALVLEVGSGGNPYPRANVLLDAYEESRHRHWVPLVADRPTVLGFVENLPFKDKVFDFVIASHVLEHSTEPERFLGELQRVSKAGYIEVPDAFFERINPYRDHRLEITARGGLIIRKKKAWQVDCELVELYEHRAKAVIARETMPRRPFEFHVRYYWEDAIDFTVINPEVNCEWPAPESRAGDSSLPKPYAKAREIAQRLLRRMLSQNRRNRSLDLIKLLRCPACLSDDLLREADLVCPDCTRRYPIMNGIPQMNVPNP
ncbi:MAG: methyltransferase domain-containing protein [Desulfomonile tiedjei]|nr:methyltransferase domain-containing protein [Desulfomonile tiedjei]